MGRRPGKFEVDARSPAQSESIVQNGDGSSKKRAPPRPNSELESRVAGVTAMKTTWGMFRSLHPGGIALHNCLGWAHLNLLRRENRTAELVCLICVKIVMDAGDEEASVASSLPVITDAPSSSGAPAPTSAPIPIMDAPPASDTLVPVSSDTSAIVPYMPFKKRKNQTHPTTPEFIASHPEHCLRPATEHEASTIWRHLQVPIWDDLCKKPLQAHWWHDSKYISDHCSKCQSHNVELLRRKGIVVDRRSSARLPPPEPETCTGYHSWEDSKSEGVAKSYVYSFRTLVVT